MKVILFMQVIVHVCFSTEVYRVPVYYQNHRIIVDVSLERQDNTMIVSTSTTNLPNDVLPSVNYHDFNTIITWNFPYWPWYPGRSISLRLQYLARGLDMCRGLVLRPIWKMKFNNSMKAFKHIDNGECIIFRTSETISMVDRILGKILRNNFHQHPIGECSILDRRRLSNDEVEAIAGRRIREFCSGYKSYTSKSIRREVTSRSDIPEEHILFGRRKSVCVFCWGKACSG